jgi:Tfp pilus assembly protein PilZ
VSGPERRQHPRAEVDLLVQYRADTFEDFEVAYATNLSESGLFLASKTALPVGAMVHFQFVLRDGTSLIEALGRVTYASPSGGMGIGLQSIDDSSRDQLRAAVRARIEAGQASPTQPLRGEPAST